MANISLNVVVWEQGQVKHNVVNSVTEAEFVAIGRMGAVRYNGVYASSCITYDAFGNKWTQMLELMPGN